MAQGADLANGADDGIIYAINPANGNTIATFAASTSILNLFPVNNSGLSVRYCAGVIDSRVAPPVRASE